MSSITITKNPQLKIQLCSEIYLGGGMEQLDKMTVTVYKIAELNKRKKEVHSR